MIRFALGHFLVLLAIPVLNHENYRTLVSTFAPPYWPFVPGFDWQMAAADGVQLCVLPALIAVSLASVMHTRRARLVFSRAGHTLQKMGRGVCSGILAVALAMPLSLLTIDRQGYDWAVLPLTSLIATFAIMMISRRRRPGTCSNCEYDVRASLSAGRCPECGLSLAPAI